MDLNNEGLQALLECAASVLVETSEGRSCQFFKVRRDGVPNGKCEQCKYFADEIMYSTEYHELICPEQKRLNRIESDIEYFAPDEM